MQRICLLQVVLALSSLIQSKSQGVIGSGHSCLRSRTANDGQTRITFLREDVLYLSLWSEDIRLVSCECANVYQTHKERCESWQNSEETRMDFPRTMWCGTGSQAVRYDQLGMFESADRCCREHDHCLHVIPSFTRNYGVFNRNLYTVSHCDCDQRFRQCLLSVNDSISSMVGYSFFSILRVPCFELKQKKHCTQLYWWGTCKVPQSAPYAVLESPLPYASENNTSGEPMGSTRAQSTLAERRPKQNIVLHNVTDNQLLCESLKYLDECKYKIRPLKKKFDLQNNESKTVYHCDCTSR
ncbi:hypothetical protein KUCAC02_028962 [Chaenocephalus aceratus]|uniref:Uncharacterized protein n=1 Tax=Chaenocephalus aceratus TaxID=36190 RepID=A0ACB9X426_CHAAC|nr:hypothetical protein KUCAC02_028962 [Chaenocephalus aceratus]